MLSKHGRVLILAGEFGSGKTWTLRWLASELSRRSQHRRRSVPIPVVVNLTGLGDRSPADRDELLSLATPNALSGDLLQDSGKQIILLLDGIDEILGVPDARQERITTILQSIVNLEPKSTRFVVACRRHIAEATGLRDRLDRIIGTDSLDPTKAAVARALNSATSDVEMICIADVQATKADAYLSKSHVGSIWRTISTQRDYRDLTRAPFTIFLLEETLPSISMECSRPTLPVLYQTAVDVWLARKNPNARDFGRLYHRLEELATADFTNPHITAAPETDQELIDAGILERSVDSVTFRHYSLLEYFLARRLQRDFSTYSTALLKRLNLIYMYNVNRFLIPMLMPRAPIKANSLKLISRSAFHRFMMRSGWRRHGYGIWPDLDAPDGIQPGMLDKPLGTAIDFLGATNEESEEDQGPVTGISWYDAYQFCRYEGGRLPTADELRCHLDQERSTYASWSSSWYDEEYLWIAVVVPDLHAELSAQ